jgi:hypothetical protein
MSIKTPLIAALVAAGFICQASAANVVYLTGSTAFRSTMFNALNTPGTVFDAGTVTRATRSGSTTNNSSYMLFFGKISGTDTYIDCYWNGSEAGIACAANVSVLNDGLPLAGNPAIWLKADGSVPMTDTGSTGPTSSELETNSHGADLACADSSQAVSLTPFVAGTSTALKDYGVMGIIAFTWAKNVNSSPNAAWSNLKNITTYQMQALLAAPQHAALLTGVATDTNYVYVVGRNKGSGTRVNVLADASYGITTAVNQFSIGGGVSTSTSGTLSLLAENDNGYESGGGVATALGIDGSCGQTDPYHSTYPGWLAVGYLSCSDAITHGLTVANNWLTENGVPESDGAVIEGQYSYWGNEHIFGKYLISGYQDTVGSKIFNGMVTLLNTTAPSLTAHDAPIGTTWMHCTKPSDTSYPNHK